MANFEFLSTLKKEKLIMDIFGFLTGDQITLESSNMIIAYLIKLLVIFSLLLKLTRN